MPSINGAAMPLRPPFLMAALVDAASRPRQPAPIGRAGTARCAIVLRAIRCVDTGRRRLAAPLRRNALPGSPVSGLFAAGARHGRACPGLGPGVAPGAAGFRGGCLRHRNQGVLSALGKGRRRYGKNGYAQECGQPRWCFGRVYISHHVLLEQTTIKTSVSGAQRGGNTMSRLERARSRAPTACANSMPRDETKKEGCRAAPAP